MFLVEQLMNKNTCSKCGDLKQLQTKRYCRACTNSYNREWRKLNHLTEKQRFNGNVRRNTLHRIKSGKINKKLCEVCGGSKTEAHHDDYTKPYDIRWFCVQHHVSHHKKIKS